MTLIGNSGFEYTTTTTIKAGYTFINSRTATIKNIKNGDIIFKLTGKRLPSSVGTKKFLGLDNKYYYIEVLYNKVDWGQIQSDGAVLRSDRTILKILPFFPHYKEPETIVPVETPIIIKEPPNIPKVVVISPTPIKTPIPKEKVSWIQKIINWIIAILNR